jgi:DNA-binding CsgD family transcriptional regulator
MTHAGVAADLGIKESTVKTFRNRAFERLGINFRSQLFALFTAGG